MLVTKLSTNVKGPHAILDFDSPVTGIYGDPRSGKSRFAQSLQLAIYGSLPRLGRQEDLMTLVPHEASKNGSLYARAIRDNLAVAEFEAKVVGGKLRRPAHHVHD